MSGEFTQPNKHLHTKRRRLWKIFENGVRTEHNSPSREVVQCAACLEMTDCSDDQTSCSYCGANLRAPVAVEGYSNHVPELVPLSHDVYYLTRPKRDIDQRQHRRIACKNVRACIRTENGAEVVVHLINISRGGLCFVSDADFRLHAPVHVATHYFEGGQNIFQEGQIVRVQRKPTALIPGEFAIQFSSSSKI